MENSASFFSKKKNHIILVLALIFFNVDNLTFAQNEITINKVNGLFKIPCKINGVFMDFIFDTGATNVSISITEAMFLIKQGLLNSSDILGEDKFRIASGAIENGSIINIRKIEIEGIVLENVRATVVNNLQAPLLLGMSAISRLGTIQLTENRLIINKGDNTITQNLKDDKFENFYPKAKSAIFKILKIGANGGKVDGYIREYFDLFEAPISGDGLTGQFDKTNKDSLTVAQDVKDFIKHFNTNTKAKNINWNLITNDDFKFIIDDDDIITTIRHNNKFYIFRTWFYLNQDKKYVINLEPVLQTLAAYQYNKELHQIFDQFDKKKITHLDYLTQQVAYAEQYYPYLTELDLVDVRMGNKLDEIYNAAAYINYSVANNYTKAMYLCNKVLQIKNSRFIDDSYFLRAKCKYRLKDNLGAIADFDKYLTLDPKVEYTQVFLMRGWAKEELGDFKGALADYKKSATMNANDDEAHYLIGLIEFNHLNDKKRACISWSKAGELGSKNAYKLIEKYCN